MKTKVAIQGQAGSFHHIASSQFFNNKVELVKCETFADTFAALNQADAAVVAIENSLFGSINKVYDLLLQNKSWIVGEVYLRIEQCLLGVTGSKLADINEVHTQLEALAQCEDYLDQHLPLAKRIEQHDTAASADMISSLGDKHKAAIASQSAAELYNLKVLAKGIETNKQNYTRFVIINKEKSGIKEANKTSLVLTTKGDTKPGALYKALGAFARHDLNLTMLQSRPVIGKAWHYLFYVDVAESIDHPKLQSALKSLDKLNYHVDILGSYKSGLQ